MPKGGTRKIIVKDLKVIHKGRNRQGSEYTIRQVVATTEQGIPIEQNLRTFEENLPKNQPIEVEIEVYNSEQYGTSYTVKRAGAGRKGLGKKVDALEGEVNQLKVRLAKLEERIKAAAPAAAQAPQAAPPAQPPPQPPPVAPQSGGLPSDDDIPF